MEQNPYESPRHAGIDRPSSPSKPKRARSYEYVVVAVIVATLAYLIIPAWWGARERQAARDKLMIDPVTGYVITKEEFRKRAEQPMD
jgi:hypothetical protein